MKALKIITICAILLCSFGCSSKNLDSYDASYYPIETFSIYDATTRVQLESKVVNPYYVLDDDHVYAYEVLVDTEDEAVFRRVSYKKDSVILVSNDTGLVVDKNKL